MSDDLLTPDDLAAQFGGVSRARVLEWRKTYDWPHVRVGRRYFFTPEQFAQIVKQHAVAGKKPDAWGRSDRSRKRAS